MLSNFRENEKVIYCKIIYTSSRFWFYVNRIAFVVSVVFSYQKYEICFTRLAKIVRHGLIFCFTITHAATANFGLMYVLSYKPDFTLKGNFTIK